MEDKREPTQPLRTPEQVFGLVAKRLREVCGYSQESVADKMKDHGHSWRQTTVAKTEAAARPIRLNEVVSLARIFDADLGQLLARCIEDSAADERVVELVALRRRALDVVESGTRQLREDRHYLEHIKAELEEATKALRRRGEISSGEGE